jgi:hypothetical protein
VDEALSRAGVPAEAVDHVFLTGGTSFVPSVRKRGGGTTLRGGSGLAPDVVHDGGRRDGEAVFAGRERSYE